MHGNRVGNGTDFLRALAGNPVVEEREKKEGEEGARLTK
jgi:hypothetical protein